ncbi:7-carboxy-7-deazaguanine synthase QueE [Halosquirtibacter xylanolyticus]|uniref:7-carboxy-7-deazaguanine synthase QueE n=1 Tax=Halosquirtibacter xylanolyticus TaxID=3374599 RepID=UPI003748454D|nr:7-carboxy-7-deazaguanine synthase QueE [Prolixibacteraceae bacterium]
MPQLILAEGGVFPIMKGLHGEELNPKTGFSIAGTIQGEGKLAGVPSLFIRLYGCNLDCAWKNIDGEEVRCDTPHAIDPEMKKEKWAVEDLLKVVQQNIGNMRHLVITGGEPLLQSKALIAFLEILKRWREDIHVTVETNGTIFSNSLKKYVDLFSVSPKLSSSTYRKNPHVLESLEFNVEKFALARLRNKIDLQLKFVVSSEEDMKEIEVRFKEVLQHVTDDDVLLMPMGIGDASYQEIQKKVCQWAIERGWRFAPRLHLTLFGHVENT